MVLPSPPPSSLSSPTSSSSPRPSPHTLRKRISSLGPTAGAAGAAGAAAAPPPLPRWQAWLARWALLPGSRRVLMLILMLWLVTNLSLFVHVSYNDEERILQIQFAHPRGLDDDDNNDVDNRDFAQGGQRARRAMQSHSGSSSGGGDTANGATTTSFADKKMNILLFYADDWRHDTLGIAGNPVIQTPHLDKLARRGVRFTHNCVTTSVCWISRATLFTGQYLSRHGHYNMSQRWSNPWNNTYLAKLREEGGYYVGYLGKWGVQGMPNGKLDFNREERNWHYKNFTVKMPNGTKVDREFQVTERNEWDALEFLRDGARPRDRPFCLTMAFFATHALDHDRRQYMPQQESLRRYYVHDTIPPPPNLDHFDKLPYFFTETNEGRVRFKWRYDVPDKFQLMMKNLYRMATEVDTAVGNVLAELDRLGIRNETLVIFTTDNGNLHGEHGIADKWYPFEESIRVPLIIDDPRMPASVRGTTRDELTLNIDLAPTLMTAAGVTVPTSVQGRDISVLYLPQPQQEQGSKSRPSWPLSWLWSSKKDNVRPWRTEFYYEHPLIKHANYVPQSQALVRKDYKYMFWPDYQYEQLFDLQADPTEDFDLLPHEEHRKADGTIERRKITAVPQPPKKLPEMRKRFQQLQKRAAMAGSL